MATFIQCALNGGYGKADHPAVPVTTEEIVADAVACARVGARSVHLHPRSPDDGLQTLAAPAHDAVVGAIRRAAPGLEISCSTAEDIELGGARDRVNAVRAWRDPPEVVSLNLAEDGCFELGAALVAAGIGIEAGVFTLDGAERLLAAPWATAVRRVLVETILEHDDHRAVALALAIDERVAVLGHDRVWHGDGRASWAVVDAGLAAGVGVRVGLEDSLLARDGGPAPGNADQVAETIQLAR